MKCWQSVFSLYKLSVGTFVFSLLSLSMRHILLQTTRVTENQISQRKAKKSRDDMWDDLSSETSAFSSQNPTNVPLMVCVSQKTHGGIDYWEANVGVYFTGS